MENRKLKAKLVEMSKTYSDCANAIGISLTSFTKKMNDNKFLIDEATKLADYLNLSDEERCYIFLR